MAEYIVIGITVNAPDDRDPVSQSGMTVTAYDALIGALSQAGFTLVAGPTTDRGQIAHLLGMR